MDNFALHQILVPEKSKEKGGNAHFITELSEQSGKIDFEARVYKVDELPYNGDDYLYFTLTDD